MGTRIIAHRGGKQRNGIRTHVFVTTRTQGAGSGASRKLGPDEQNSISRCTFSHK